MRRNPAATRSLTMVEVQDVMRKLAVPKQLRTRFMEGLEIEWKEHGGGVSALSAGQLVADHLEEDPDYYRQARRNPRPHHLPLRELRGLTLKDADRVLASLDIELSMADKVEFLHGLEMEYELASGRIEDWPAVGLLVIEELQRDPQHYRKLKREYLEDIEAQAGRAAWYERQNPDKSTDPTVIDAIDAAMSETCPSCRENPISQAALRTVDVEIRDIIEAINQLPFVKQTIFSCAGYGKAGSGNRHPAESTPTDLLGHHPWNGVWVGYVMVAYKKDTDEWRDFHEALSNLATRTGKNSFWQKKLNRPVFNYEFATRSQKALANRWKKVAHLVENGDGHARQNPDKSTDPTVIEYAVRFMHKGKTPKQAAAATKKQLHGSENLMLGGGVAEIDEGALEDAIYARIYELAQYGLSRGWTPEDSVRSALQSSFYSGFDDKTLALVEKVTRETLKR